MRRDYREGLDGVESLRLDLVHQVSKRVDVVAHLFELRVLNLDPDCAAQRPDIILG